MELSLRCRCWSVLQVVAIVICYRGKVLSAEIVQGCVGSQLSLRCPPMMVIQITAVVLGDTYCAGASCCIRDGDCTQNANANHRKDVHHACSNQRECTVDVIQESINCGFVGWSNNDFERITYNCRDDPSRSTTTTLPGPGSTEDKVFPEDNPTPKDTENGGTTSSTEAPGMGDSDQIDNGGKGNEGSHLVLPVVMAVICLLVLIAIVAVVVMLRRKRWLKGGATVEMADFDLYRAEAIYANENQTTSQNNGSGFPVYSNDKIKKSTVKGAKASEDYEVPSNAVYSLADDAGSRPTEDTNIYCDVDSREPAYLEPRSRDDVYSVVRDVGELECAGSTADASNVDNIVYSDVETREPAQTTNSSARKSYDEALDWKESDYEEVRSDETILSTRNTNTGSPVHKATPVSYTNVPVPLKIAGTYEPLGRVESKDRGSSTCDGFPTPTYETMSPGIPESIYANEPALSPSWSVASSRALSTASSRALSTGGGSDTYCDMQSPPVRFKDDGSQTVVENDLYSH